MRAEKAIWFVSFALHDANVSHKRFPRQTRTFPSEQQAKAFASSLLEQTPDIAAGTINPHLPRRIIAPAAIAAWVGDL
ncbi:hypothetical protein JQ633_31010 [Bradyrhizobium tropiciagri]|uniref:hypothetical protein n=1 Tax=Bradyrhizobium tropiciagri TaxID=312253 RepID=UPI001BAAC279|nr:hypothetical protein [Bradyrhizobium tropiciagri]MBR0874822.1 hypothetical protein [Bradyrhizobium tropiciagri]